MAIVDFTTIVTIAFLGSFGHCIGMCGGIVIAYSASKVDNTNQKLTQILSHLSYSFGRITTYVALGVFFGYLGSIVAFNNVTNGILYFIAGTFMVLAGLSLIGKFQFLTLIEHSVSNRQWYKRTFTYLLKSKTVPSFFLLGMLNGLLPCGFVYFFAITAASTADPFLGGLVMAVFGLSTLPAMFSLGYFVGFLKQQSFRDLMIKIASIAVIAYGIYTLFKSYGFIMNPSMTLLNCH
ncbi:MAG: sulfite exporter TauE/SafE family protein [Campylobacterales bacterium]|nr:sulfite exporter TauE/SafE family protein [Campylobacterales bacterium]